MSLDGRRTPARQYPPDYDGPGPDPTPEDLEAAAKAAAIDRQILEAMRRDIARDTRRMIDRARRQGLTPEQLGRLFLLAVR
jgi:hypothetical protein